MKSDPKAFVKDFNSVQNSLRDWSSIRKTKAPHRIQHPPLPPQLNVDVLAISMFVYDRHSTLIWGGGRGECSIT